MGISCAMSVPTVPTRADGLACWPFRSALSAVAAARIGSYARFAQATWSAERLRAPSTQKNMGEARPTFKGQPLEPGPHEIPGGGILVQNERSSRLALVSH
jgi:hypothetical protein